MERNAHFEELRKETEIYDEAQQIRKQEKEKLIKAEDWDAVEAWNAREKKEFPYPLSRGQVDAMIAYNYCLRSGADAFEVNELPWKEDCKDFISELRKAGIKTITVTDQSTALMRGIYSLTALGCTMKGLKTVTRANRSNWETNKPETAQGIEFQIN